MERQRFGAKGYGGQASNPPVNRMAQRYCHISTDARRAAMEAMNTPRMRTKNTELKREPAAAKMDAIH